MITTPLVLRDQLVCWRVRVVSKAAPTDHVLATFTDPARRVAVAVPASPEELLGLPGANEAADEWLFLLIPSGSTSLASWWSRAERWMRAPAEGRDTSTVELALNGDRVLWQPRRMVVEGALERLDDLVRALVHVAFQERDLQQLEREVEVEWPVCEADISLTHQVGPKELQRWGHVNACTERAARRRMRYTRLADRLAIPPQGSSTVTSRWMTELTRRTGVEQRLEQLDDRLEVVEDVYELANDRLSEYRYFRIECFIEIVVAGLLLAELVLMGWELYVTYAHLGG